MRQSALILVAMMLTAPVVFGDSPEAKVAKYIKDIENGDAKSKAAAAKEIGNIAAIKVAHAKPAVEPLLKLLKEKEASVRAAAAEALGKVDEPKKTVKPLMALVKDDNSDVVKISAAVGLGLIGDSAKEAVKVLQETARAARQDKNMRLAQACQQAIQNINGARKK